MRADAHLEVASTLSSESLTQLVVRELADEGVHARMYIAHRL